MQKPRRSRRTARANLIVDLFHVSDIYLKYFWNPVTFSRQTLRNNFVRNICSFGSMIWKSTLRPLTTNHRFFHLRFFYLTSKLSPFVYMHSQKSYIRWKLLLSQTINRHPACKMSAMVFCLFHRNSRNKSCHKIPWPEDREQIEDENILTTDFLQQRHPPRDAERFF